ncbi:MAG: hypothetical protein NTV02_00620 [Candidatus Zambryskibacteria bacterium]|nr:hypothetical protein [Candidatus Zambryskibacteria bacterium]
MNTEDLIKKLVSEWGEREVYPLEEDELNVLCLSPLARSSEYNNGDGTVTTTVLYEGKTFIYTEVRP